MPDFMKLAAVMAATLRSKPSIYRDMQKGLFPQRVKLGVRSVAWRTADISAWIANRPKVSGAIMDKQRIKSSSGSAFITPWSSHRWLDPWPSHRWLDPRQYDWTHTARDADGDRPSSRRVAK